ncbi:hypothetical protein WR25_27214 [Diploscapter pachys]|uniref:histidine kinase n=1 Tax=Diploscapter pachys TaxID=2018661 RepID=A0A2A2JX26_9BILA|nr:hypothetical protein WR25_27214 [Diploscapter pachys]
MRGRALQESPVTTDHNPLDQAIERCAQEPIQIPGSIQPQGFLLTVDDSTLRVLQASENVDRWFGLPASEILGQSFAELVSADFDLRGQLDYLPEADVFPFHIGDVRLRQGAPDQPPLRVLAHRHDQVLILEFEPSQKADGVYKGDYYPLVRAFVSSLHQATSIEELLLHSVRQIKRITGFGRVKAYRFDSEGNGTVLAESVDPGYPSYLGLSFPASDIPRQARELYRINLDVQTRTACELLASVLSLQLESRESHERTRTLLDLRERIVRMLAAMADHDSVSLGLLEQPEVLLAFAGANGAAIISAERCDLIGETPTAAQVNALVHWLGRRGDEVIFHTDNVGRDIEELPELASRVGGILAVAISQLHSHYLVWFRPEQARLVNWAGQPEKAISPQGHLSPRHSFDRWQEEVRGFSAPWDSLVIDGVLELRMAVLGIVLRKAEELAQLTGELKRSNKELEAFSYSVSHDLRAPLRHIAGYTELLNEIEGEHLSERGRRFLSHIDEAARFAGSLVDNLLNFSQMGRSALRLADSSSPITRGATSSGLSLHCQSSSGIRRS